MRIVVKISSLFSAHIAGAMLGSYSGSHIPTTELDSHANMAVAGGACMIIARTGCHAIVSPFSDTLPTMDMVEIVDVALAYDDPITTRTYLLIMRNALYIPTMEHNLISLFILREAGLYVDDTPKFQLGDDATINNHCIFDDVSGLRIHLKLNGIFSYFPTRLLTAADG